jgi:hypothetical protein
VKLTATVRYQACNDEICFPPVNRVLEMMLPVAGNGVQPSPVNEAIFAVTTRGE